MRQGICGNVLGGCGLALAVPPVVQEVEEGQPAVCSECGEELQLLGKGAASGRRALTPAARLAIVVVAAGAVLATGALLLLGDPSPEPIEPTQGDDTPVVIVDSVEPPVGPPERPEAPVGTSTQGPLDRRGQGVAISPGPTQAPGPAVLRQPAASQPAESPQQAPPQSAKTPQPVKSPGPVAVQQPVAIPESVAPARPVETPQPSPPTPTQPPETSAPEPAPDPAVPVLPEHTVISFTFRADMCARRFTGGSEILGTVTSEHANGIVDARSTLTLEVGQVSIDQGVMELSPRSLNLRDGRRFDVEGIVVLADLEQRSAATKKATAAKIGVGVIVGAGTGAVITGDLEGAAKGAAIGAAAGGVVALATRGRDVCVPKGTPLTVTLTKPVILQ